MDRKQFKLEAKEAIRGAKPSPVLITLAVLAITLVLQVLSMRINGDLAALKEMFEGAMAGQQVYVEPKGAVGFGWILTLAIEVMVMVVTTGYTLYCLRISRGRKAGMGDVFDAFGLFLRAVCMSIVPSILVSAWAMVYAFPVSLLAVATGQVWPMVAGLPLLFFAYRALYSYRLSVYIMLDDPRLNCFQCIALSKTAMVGHRWELFKLDLSFIGWHLLSAIPFVWLWVLPYIRVTEAKFYACVMGDFAQRTGYVPRFEGDGEEPAADGEDPAE